jgi:hypothetical protein
MLAREIGDLRTPEVSTKPHNHHEGTERAELISLALLGGPAAKQVTASNSA